MLSQASAFYSFSSGCVTRQVTISTVQISLSAHTMARCSSSLSVFAFATLRCSDGRAAERAAAQLDNMVESRLLHGNSLAPSTTLSPTVTSWCVLHVDCAALALHTRVERHSAFRLRAQPAVATHRHQLTSSGPLAMLHATRCQLRSPRPPRSSHLLSSWSVATS